MFGNPVLAGKGVTDPHIHIFNDKAYLYASHDEGPGKETYTMRDWWIWSSDDLVNWTHESTIYPKDTYINDDAFDKCFAIDAAYYKGKYYIYFSEFVNSVGVLVSDTPVGPWRDPLGKPLVGQGDVPAHRIYDPGIFIDDDDTPYLVFGHMPYYIVRLNEDMISLAETPREVLMPSCGAERCGWEDKAFLHKYNRRYYFSAGAHYGFAENVYGPYPCKGTLFKEENFPETHRFKGGKDGIETDRHGSFFEWKGRWFYACNELSQTQDEYYRDFSIFEVSYRENGEIAPFILKPEGVRV